MFLRMRSTNLDKNSPERLARRRAAFEDVTLCFNKIAFQSKVDHPQTGYTNRHACDLDLDPMTLIYELDLNILHNVLSQGLGAFKS